MSVLRSINSLLNNKEYVMDKLPICRISLFSSGVGFFEHRGTITGNSDITLPFHISAVNDALMSLVINNPGGISAVSYPLEETLSRTLKSLSLDLKGSSLYSLFQSLKGTEIEIFIPDSVKGRIIFVERRAEKANGANINKDFLTLNTEKGIKTICIDEINNFIFTDPKITADLNRALDLVIQSRDDDTRNLTIKLNGEAEREAALSYVIPSALWKVSYRLDLSQEKPFLQGWAIVDNDSDSDWENIELSLITGKPVSFIQKLYDVHRVKRPTVPLLIEGIAEAKTFDSGSERSIEKKPTKDRNVINKGINISKMMGNDICGISRKDKNAEIEIIGNNDFDCLLSSGPIAGEIETASSRPVGEQFEFTIKKPVSLSRQQSTMLPLVESEVKAEKFLVCSYSLIGKGVINPAICVELTNNSDMKLPAGPITVYDDENYAGDALIKFFPENEKRLISYGEDLSVTCSFTVKENHKITLIKIDKGVIFYEEIFHYETVYTFRNAGKDLKKLIIEHPFGSGKKLISPEYNEKTHNLYRFKIALPPSSDFLNFIVIEEKTRLEKTEIIDSGIYIFSPIEKFLSDNANMKENIREILKKAVELFKKIEIAENRHVDLKEKCENLIEKQERTRKNLEAAGNQTQQGKEFLQRLVKEEETIEALEKDIITAEKAVEAAKKEYEEYIMGLKIE